MPQTPPATQERVIHFLDFIRDPCSTTAKYDPIDKWRRLKWRSEAINILYPAKHENPVLSRATAVEELATLLPQFKENPNMTQALLQLTVENLASEYFLGRHQIVSHPASENLLYLYYASTNNPLRRYNKDVFNHPQLSTFADTALRLNHFITEKAIEATDFLSSSFQPKIANKLRVKPSHQNLDIFNSCELIQPFLDDFNK